MRIQTLLFGCAILAICLVKRSDAVPCTGVGVPVGCTDCSLAINYGTADCPATTTPATATTTTATTTAASASATTTTTASSAATTTTTASSGSGNGARRRLLRRLRLLRKRLYQCRRNAAHQRAVLISKIKSLTSSNQQSSKFRPNINKLFG